ncbi:MAG: hypothetical protein HY820_39220 [Acidobacteria bacterium]|nr:hypothetical protein [Acidobacteriota bacterium]
MELRIHLNTIACLLLPTIVAVAQTPLPEMVVEATDGGSALVIRNIHPSAALTAYLVELVDYPGSSFAFSQDELAQGGDPLPAGKLRRLPIANMTVGAAPDYVKMRAALYADGSSSGPDDKVAQLRSRRAMLLATIREILAQPANLKALLEAAPFLENKRNRSMPEVVDRASKRALIQEAMELHGKSAAGMIEKFRARETALRQ